MLFAFKTDGQNGTDGAGSSLGVTAASSSSPTSSAAAAAAAAAAGAGCRRQHASKAAKSRKGCRCGTATNNPGTLTCCGQRCPCYVEAKECIDCKCRGCRNPYRSGGRKVIFLYPVAFPRLTYWSLPNREESGRVIYCIFVFLSQFSAVLN